MNLVAKICLVIVVSISFFYLGIFLIFKSSQYESKVFLFSVAFALSGGASLLSLVIWRRVLDPKAKKYIALIVLFLLFSAFSISYYFLRVINVI